MKKQNILYLASFLFAVVLLSSCGGIKKMAKNQELLNFSAQPEVLEMHGDKVEVSLNGTFPAKFFAKKAIVSITPVLRYVGGEKEFKTIILQGEDAEANNKVISYENGGNFSYNDIISYTTDMRVSQLYLKISAEQGSKSVDFIDTKIADGVISTPLLLMVDGKPIYGTTKKVNYTPSSYDPSQSVFQQKVMESLEADIHFMIQQSNIRRSEKRDADIKAMEDYLETIKNNERINLEDIQISSYASPDGEYSLNDKLSGNRGTKTEKFINKELKKKKIVDTKIKTVTTAEDWEGFKEEVKASNIQDKDLILRVLSMYSDPAVREKEIKNMSATFKNLATDVLPKLRRSKLKVNTEVTGFYDNEISELAKTNPDTLNQAELLYAADLTDDLNEKLDIFKFFSSKYKSDWRGPNNAGVILTKQKKYNDAKNEFAEAKSRNENSIVLNNLGVTELFDGNFTDAENYFKAALTAGKKASYNLGIVDIKKGDYTKAISDMGSCSTSNVALAQILNGNYNKALQTLEALENKEAIDYYLKAIVGARTGNDELVFSSLKTAISKDVSFAKKAATDIEFAKYFKVSTFMELVK